MLAAVVGLAVAVFLLILAPIVVLTFDLLGIRELRSLVKGQRADFDTLASVLRVKDGIVEGIERRFSAFQTETSQRITLANNRALMVDDRLQFHERQSAVLGASRKKYDRRIAEMQAEHAAKVEAAQQAAAKPQLAPVPDEESDAAQEGVGQVVGQIGQSAEASA